MFRAIQNFFTAPYYANDPLRTENARTTQRVLLALIAIGILGGLIAVRPGASDRAGGVAGFGVIFIWLGCLALNKRGHTLLANIIVIGMNALAINGLVYVSGGLPSLTAIANILIIALAALLLPARGIFGAAVATFLLLLVLYFRAPNASGTYDATGLLIIYGFTAVASAFVLEIAAGNLRSAVNRARSKEQEVSEKNAQLQAFTEGLEKLVDERTADLAAANRQMTRRAAQLQAVSDVARAIASIQDIDSLLPEITRAISRSFSVYHVGIFLIDKENRFAVLSAANSEGGQRMLSRAHKLEIGRTGIVGNVASSGQPRVALDTGADATYFNNPDLPETHSEMALPLKIGTEIIGVLDVQSTETNAFSPEDVDVLSTLSNQVAIAIQNARLFSQTRVALAEAESAFQRYVAEGWQAYTRDLAETGFMLKEKRLAPLEGDLAPTANKEALHTGRIAVEQSHQPVLAIPIRVRGTTIGVMNVRAGANDRTWNADELTTAQTIADRVAIALENARLVEETRERAGRERAIAEMSNRIGASIDMDNILTTAVRELGRLVPDSDVVIQLGRPADTE